MRFADLSPSTSWAALKYKGVTIAEVWFKPDDEPHVVSFRIPAETVGAPELGNALNIRRLLSAVGIAGEDAESWRLEGAANSDPIDLAEALPAPEDDSDHLLVHVWLKPSEKSEVLQTAEEREQSERLQDLESRWRVLLGLESNIESMRLKMDLIRGEMEATVKKPLTAEEKLNALQADVAQWTRAKNRVHFSLPKAKEFIHRATWLLGAADRKQLEEAYAKHVESPTTHSEPELEPTIKDRNIFLTQGNAVYTECRNVISGIQAALRTLQINSTAQARKKKPER